MFSFHTLINQYIFTAVSSVFSELAPNVGCIAAAVSLHQLLTKGVLRSPMLFFDTTPLGRILSRFSKDIEVVDNSLPWYVSDGLYCFFEVPNFFSNII